MPQKRSATQADRYRRHCTGIEDARWCQSRPYQGAEHGRTEGSFGNLDKHIRNLRYFGQTVVVAFNRFASDTDEEVEAIRRHCEEDLKVGFAINNAFPEGGKVRWTWLTSLWKQSKGSHPPRCNTLTGKTIPYSRR